MRSALRPWIHAAAAVLLANAGFLLLALWVAQRDRAPLENRIVRAFAAGDLIENDWPWLDRRRGFNQYDDCSALQMLSNRDTSRWAAAVGPLIHNRSKGETERCATLRALVTEGPGTRPYLTYRYTRYWHGYLPLAGALLSVLEVRQMRQVLELTLYASLLLLIAAAGTRDRRLFAVGLSIALTGVLFWSVPYFGKSLAHGPGDTIVILGAIVLLHWRHRLSHPWPLIIFCAVYGSLVAYLEFLTGQLPTAAGLLVPLVYLVVRAQAAPGDGTARAWRLAGTALVAFGLGAAGTVAIKQALAVITVGPESGLAFLEYLRRYVNPSPGAALRHFGESWTSPDDPLVVSSLKSLYVLVGEGYVLTYGSHTGAVFLYAASALSWLAAGWVSLTRRHSVPVSDFLGFAAGAAIVVAWTLAFQTHTTIHKWWMVRMLLVPLSLGWGALAWQLLTRRGERVHVAHGKLAAAHEAF
jgi:hypothetical protein